jgi:DNA modification methylase
MITTIKGDESVGQSSRITLINDDCLNAMKDIADGSIDMILCDLPYG